MDVCNVRGHGRAIRRGAPFKRRECLSLGVPHVSRLLRDMGFHSPSLRIWKAHPERARLQRWVPEPLNRRACLSRGCPMSRVFCETWDSTAHPPKDLESATPGKGATSVVPTTSHSDEGFSP